MQLRLAAASASAAAAMLLSLSFLLLPSTTAAFNITHILAGYSDFSTFNDQLNTTLLAQMINRRETITVCVVDNEVMAAFLLKNPSPVAIKKTLSFQVLLDYFDGKKLHQIADGTMATTLYQSTGDNTEFSGLVKITHLNGGKVGFSRDGTSGVGATFVKTVTATPYNISVIQISSLLLPAESEAPSPAPSQTNLTALMLANRCNAFANTLIANPAAQKTFDDNVHTGLTIFCPDDDAMNSFFPKYNNLTADDKQSLLEYHGTSIYHSLSGWRSRNGATNTLATDGARKFNFKVQNNGSDVTIKTGVVTARIIDTVTDERPQKLAIFKLNKVLLPKEIFQSDLSPAPAPAPEADAGSPKPSKNNKPSPVPSDSPSDSPADAPDGDAADEAADNDGGDIIRFSGGRFGSVILTLLLVVLQL